MLVQMLRSRALPYVLLVIAMLAIAYLRDRNDVIKEDNVRLKGNATTAIESSSGIEPSSCVSVVKPEVRPLRLNTSSKTDNTSFRMSMRSPCFHSCTDSHTIRKFSGDDYTGNRNDMISVFPAMNRRLPHGGTNSR